MQKKKRKTRLEKNILAVCSLSVKKRNKKDHIFINGAQGAIMANSQITIDRP